MNEIREFRGRYRFLSNYYEAPIRLRGAGFEDGIVFTTNEAAFAAAKTLDIAQRRHIAALPTPGAAKKAGRSVTLRTDWEEIKYGVMHQIVRAKFRQHPDLADALLATGDAVLVEGNTWGDRTWGVDLRTNTGTNWLGQILMLVRAELAQHRAAAS